jgi:hypothetical protein
VRTKYMALEDGAKPRLTTRTGIWTPFRFEIVHRTRLWASEKSKADLPLSAMETLEQSRVLTYGSVVRLVDRLTGARSDAVRLVRVNGGEAIRGRDEGHPISDHQRIGLVRICDEEQEAIAGAGMPNEARYYLSAPGARQGGGELLGHRYVKVKEASAPAPPSSDIADPPATLQEASLAKGQSGDVEEVAGLDPSHPPMMMRKKQKRTKQSALAKATLAEEEDSSLIGLAWQKAEGEMKEVPPVGKKNPAGPTMEYVEKIEDWMAWIITGVGEHQDQLDHEDRADRCRLPLVWPDRPWLRRGGR